MEPANTLTTYAPAALEVVRNTDRLEVRADPGRVSLYTGQATVRQSQNYARIVGALAAAVGIALLWYTMWGAAVIAFGLLAVAVVPRYLRPAELVAIDTVANQLVVVQPIVGAGTTVPLDRIQSIRGAYDTKGWDGFSVLYAVEGHGSEVPVMMLLGTDERLAEAACHTLGELLNKPATYSGPFGGFSVCYAPEVAATAPRVPKEAGA